MSKNGDKKPVGFATHITAGGIAGAMEAVSVHIQCRALHIMIKGLRSAANRSTPSRCGCNSPNPGWPLGYVTNNVVRRSSTNPRQTKPRGFLATGLMIVRRETPLALYKGLGAVLSGIVPKMAIRFASFETYKELLADKSTGNTRVGNIFIGNIFKVIA